MQSPETLNAIAAQTAAYEQAQEARADLEAAQHRLALAEATTAVENHRRADANLAIFEACFPQALAEERAKA